MEVAKKTKRNEERIMETLEKLRYICKTQDRKFLTRRTKLTVPSSSKEKLKSSSLEPKQYTSRFITNFSSTYRGSFKQNEKILTVVLKYFL